MTNNSTGPDDAGALALRAAQAGATAIAAVVASGGVRTDFKSGGHDLVTTADKAAEAAVIEVIRAARPDDAILGEEGGALVGTSGSRWLVDPLDGTANFVYGRADHAVSVGLETVAGRRRRTAPRAAESSRRAPPPAHNRSGPA